MKNFVFALIVIFISCKTEKKENKNSNSELTETSIVTNFINDINSLETATTKTPILDFEKVAKESANKHILFSKENINEVLSLAKNYKNCIIIVEKHTLVKIKNINDCKPSGSWSACMPSSKGYIKKGKLVKQDNYLNFIIGTPDDQKRTAYFFN